MKNKRGRNLRTLLKKNSRGKRLVVISALILTLMTCIAFIAAVEAVTVANPDLDAASLSLSLFKKPSPTGYVVDDSGNTIATVTVKAGEEVGRVRDDFYGASMGDIVFSNQSYIATNIIYDFNEFLDDNWAKQQVTDSKFGNIRTFVYLSNLSISEGIFITAYPYKSIYTMNSIKDEVQWAYENNITVILSLVDMPEWLADKTSGYCDENKSYVKGDNWGSCNPSNYTKYGNLVVDFTDYITNSGEYDNVIIEIWNEPNENNWLNNLSTSNIIKAIEYSKLFNASIIAMKAYNSNITIIGPTTHIKDAESKNIWHFFMNNFTSESNENAKFSFHYISTDYTGDNILGDIYTYCSSSGFNCTTLYNDEWKHKNISEQNITSNWNKWSNNFASQYTMFLKYPQNLSNGFFYFLGKRLNFNDAPIQAVINPRFDNALMFGTLYLPPYNVTKDFAHYHAGGNMIVNSSSNNNSIKSVASLNPQGIWHITVINTAINNIDVNIDVSSTGVEAIKELSNNKIYPVNNGIANVGILTEYDVKHYEGIADYEVEEKTSTSIGSSSVGKNKIVSTDNLNIASNEFVAIETDTSIVIPTSEIFVNTYTSDKNTKEEKEEFYGPIQSEEDISEIEYKSLTGSLSLSVSNNSYLVILIILLGSIICTSLIISIIYRKKKREADKVKKLMDWVDKARALGYSNDKMKEMLAQYDWNKDLVENVVGK